MTDHAAPLRPLLMAVASNGDMPRSARKHATEGEEAPGFMDTLGATVDTIVALEAAAETATEHAKRLRDALLAVIVETNPPAVPGKHHLAGTRWEQKLRITDPAALPPHFMRARDPVPNTPAIQAALRAGQAVPGAVLSNAEPTLFIRSRKA